MLTRRCSLSVDEAWKQLRDETTVLAQRYICAYDGNSEDVEDIVNDVLLQTFQKLREDIRCNPKKLLRYGPWSCRAQLRKYFSAVTTPTVSQFPSWEQSAPSPEEEADAALLRRVVGALLLTISAKEAIVLQHRFSDNVMTFENIGKLFGVTMRQVCNHEQTALRKMRHPSRSDRFKQFSDPNWVPPKLRPKRKAAVPNIWTDAEKFGQSIRMVKLAAKLKAAGRADEWQFIRDTTVVDADLDYLDDVTLTEDVW